MGKYTKAIVAAIGAAATTVVSLFGGDTTIGKVATVVLAACTVAGVYLFPNTPAAN